MTERPEGYFEVIWNMWLRLMLISFNKSSISRYFHEILVNISDKGRCLCYLRFCLIQMTIDLLHSIYIIIIKTFQWYVFLSHHPSLLAITLERSLNKIYKFFVDDVYDKTFMIIIAAAAA